MQSEELPLQGMRRLIISDYLIDYAVVGGEIWIVAVRHSQQLPARPSIDPDFDYEAGED